MQRVVRASFLLVRQYPGLLRCGAIAMTRMSSPFATYTIENGNFAGNTRRVPSRYGEPISGEATARLTAFSTASAKRRLPCSSRFRGGTQRPPRREIGLISLQQFAGLSENLFSRNQPRFVGFDLGDSTLNFCLPGSLYFGVGLALKRGEQFFS